MGKRRTTAQRPKEDEASISGNIIHPGIAKTQRVFGPVRNMLVRTGIYRPSNRWRSTQGPGQQILQRAQNLAKHLPWQTKYNFART